MDALLFLAAPFAMCVVLTGIHCYLGLHVLARGVIFVDLSLAQIAALGATVAVRMGLEPHSPYIYLCSLSATLLAAGIFALARRHERHVSQEAIIGIVYALGSAAMVLMAHQMAHGSEHIKHILVGQILWVGWDDVGKTALVYSAVGWVHYLFRRKLLAASFATHATTLATHAIKSPDSFWDFLFYALFGVVITSSVQVAGVLQVFAYLIVPAVISRFFCQSIRMQVVFGWGFSIILSFIALGLSYIFDMPSGAFIVCCFTSIPLLCLLALHAGLFTPVLSERH